MSDALELTPRPQDVATMRELRRDNARLIDAIDDIITAYYLPGEHCEFDDAIIAARELIEDMGPEKPEWAREEVKHER